MTHDSTARPVRRRVVGFLAATIVATAAWAIITTQRNVAQFIESASVSQLSAREYDAFLDTERDFLPIDLFPRSLASGTEALRGRDSQRGPPFYELLLVVRGLDVEETERAVDRVRGRPGVASARVDEVGTNRPELARLRTIRPNERRYGPLAADAQIWWYECESSPSDAHGGRSTSIGGVVVHPHSSDVLFFYVRPPLPR